VLDVDRVRRLDLNDVQASGPGRWSSNAAISRVIAARCGCSTYVNMYDFGTSNKLSPAEYATVASCKAGTYSNIPTYPGVKDVTNQPLDVTLYADRIEITGSGAYKILDKGQNTLTYEVQSSFTASFGATTVVTSRAARTPEYVPSPVWTTCPEPAANAREIVGQWFVPGSAEVQVPIVPVATNSNYAIRARRCSTVFGCDSWTESNSVITGKGFAGSTLSLFLTAYDSTLTANVQVQCTSSKTANLLDIGPVPMTNGAVRSAGVPTPADTSCRPVDYKSALGTLLTSMYFTKAGTPVTQIPASATVSDPGSYTVKLTKHCFQVTSDIFEAVPASNTFPFEHYEAQIAWMGTMVDDSQKIIKASVDGVPELGIKPAPASSTWTLAKVAGISAGVLAFAGLAAALYVRRSAAAAAAAAAAPAAAEQLLDEAEIQA
jgi:hypothetical protein